MNASTAVMPRHLWVIVPAAGMGRRMGTSVKKQFLPLRDGVELLVHTLRIFENAPQVEGILVVCASEDLGQTEALISRYNLTKVRPPVTGGASRQLSVYQGLQALPKECDFVAIHDAARPYLRPDDLEAVLAEAARYDAAVLGVPVKDTITIIDENGFARSTPDRSTLWNVQTPQVFLLSDILEAHQKAYVLGDIANSDDASLIEKYTRKRVHLCCGSYSNIKITTIDDLSFSAE